MILGLVNFFKDLVKDRQFLFRLAVNDFKAKYSGSLFGVIWAFVQPLVTILVFWFVFEMDLSQHLLMIFLSFYGSYQHIFLGYFLMIF